MTWKVCNTRIKWGDNLNRGLGDVMLGLTVYTVVVIGLNLGSSFNRQTNTISRAVRCQAH